MIIKDFSGMIRSEGSSLKNDNNYRVTLRSYNDTLLSTVDIECKNYDVFKELVENVNLILEKEESSYRKE